MAKDSPRKYIPALDGVRAIAVLVVVGFHAQVPGFGGGFLGVDVFFVLSGFLITRLLLQEQDATGSIALRTFYTRRLRRLYPALLCFLAIYLLLAATVLNGAFYPMSRHMRDAALSAVYLQDYAKTWDLFPYWLRHMWSLSIEEHFYLIWPLLFLAITRLSRAGAIFALIALYVGVTAWRMWVAQTSLHAWDVYNRFDTHSSGLILGCLLGFARTHAPRHAAMLGALGMAASIALFPHGQVSTATWGFTAAEVSAALLIAAPPTWLTGSILPWIGQISYGLYLWHYLIARMAREAYWWWPETLAVSLIGGIVCAALSFYLVERRFYRRSLPADHEADVAGMAVVGRTGGSGRGDQGIDLPAEPMQKEGATATLQLGRDLDARLE